MGPESIVGSLIGPLVGAVAGSAAQPPPPPLPQMYLQTSPDSQTQSQLDSTFDPVTKNAQGKIDQFYSSEPGALTPASMGPGGAALTGQVAGSFKNLADMLPQAMAASAKMNLMNQKQRIDQYMKSQLGFQNQQMVNQWDLNNSQHPRANPWLNFVQNAAGNLGKSAFGIKNNAINPSQQELDNLTPNPYDNTSYGA